MKFPSFEAVLKAASDTAFLRGALEARTANVSNYDALDLAERQERVKRLMQILVVNYDDIFKVKESERDAYIKAFCDGARWWEYKDKGATMWPSDQHKAASEAGKRYDQQRENTASRKPDSCQK